MLNLHLGVVPAISFWLTAGVQFPDCTQLSPQAWNKRATAYYLAQDFERSIQDCEKTLELQPNHFLAMSGMGLCYVGLEKWDEAVHWFQQSVAVHPHMDQIQTYIKTLKAKGFGGNKAS